MKSISTFKYGLPWLLFSLVVWFYITVTMEYLRSGTVSGISSFLRGLQDTGAGWTLYHLALALAGGLVFKWLTRNQSLTAQYCFIIFIGLMVYLAPYGVEYFLTPGP